MELSSSPPNDRLLEQIRFWRDQLINLTRRNRLLHFKPTRASTLVLQEPALEEIIRRLDEDERSGWGIVVPAAASEDGPEDAAAAFEVSSVARRPDELLTQFADPEKLQRALRNLGRRSGQEYLDKGIWILYLGVGMLKWKDQENEVRSPLVLKPVSITRETPRSPYRLVAMEEDVVVNPSLASKMEADFGLRLPELEETSAGDILQFISDCRALVRNRDMEVLEECVVSVFSFHKEVMYRDLKENEAAVAGSEVVRALVLGHEAGAGLGFEPLLEDRLDVECPPEKALAILGADATQQQCLAAAAAGKSFVMDGPPGTGKSQTIANMIAGALHRGDSVLFVSEKAAALEVVASRLASVGLDEYVLELHSHKATRKEFATRLAKALTTRPVPPSRLSRQSLTRLAELRTELNDYAAALNEIREPIGVSLHDVLGRVSALQELSDIPITQAVDSSLSAAHLNHVLSTAADLARAWGPVERGDAFPWIGCAAESAEPRIIQGIIGDLESARAAQIRLETTASEVADLVGFAEPRDVAATEELLGALRLMTSPPTYWVRSWVVDQRAAEAAKRLEPLATLSATHAEFVESLRGWFGDAWQDVDLDLGEALTRGLSSVREMEPSWGFTPDSGTAPLRRMQLACNKSEKALRECAEPIATLAAAFRVPLEQLTTEGLKEIAGLGKLVGLRPAPSRRWLGPLELQAAQEATAELRQHVTAYREREESLAGGFSPRVLAIDDLEDLAARFSQRHKGLRKLLAAYRADKRTVAMASRAGRATRELIERLPEAVEWKRLRDELRRAEARWAPLLGEYYHGVETDFDEVEAALANAAAILQAKPKSVQIDTLADNFSVEGRPGSATKVAADTILATLEQIKQELSSPEFELPWRVLPVVEVMPWLIRVAHAIAAVVEPLGALKAIAGRDLSVTQAREAFDLLAELRMLEQSFAATLPDDRDLLGPGYDVWRTDWALMRNGSNWASRVLDACPEHIYESAANLVTDGELDSSPLAAAEDDWREHREKVEAHFEPPQRQEIADILGGAFSEAAQLLDDLAESIEDIDEWVAFRENRKALESHGLGALIQHCEVKRLPAEDVVGAVERSVLQAWVEAVIRADKRIKRLRREQRDALVQEFRDIDLELGRHAVAEVIHACNERRPTQAMGGAGLIRAEGQKKRKHRPIRKLMADARDVIQTLKPCFMMSPLTVSQFLDPKTRFDLVLFDEASQVQPSDAINCIYRGSQVVIAGDQKQLPPTSFFMGSSDIDDDDDAWSEDQVDEFESVLDVAKAGGLVALPLRWHYRSRSEGLIAFSNYSFYDGSLITYPGPHEELESVGVELFHVEGVYRRGGSRDNPIEAEKVADRVIEHARSHPERTLGVVAFSEAQASLIEHVIERRREEHPDLDGFFDGDRLSGFFVKNLENVQGDERDTMIFSLGYGPDEFGRFTLHFGPLNRPGGERRLNVAITRARERVEVVSSVRASDFGSGSASTGVRLLARYLDYAERGVAALAYEIGPSGLDAESPFEEEVIRVIRSWGYGVQPQVGTAGYRVDIGVKESETSGRFVLGVECDGAQYHSSRVARDRDRLRQGVLENLGWNIYRIWGPAWYRTRGSEEEKLRAAIQSAIATSGGSGRSRSSGGHIKSAPQISSKEVPLDVSPTWATKYSPSRPQIRKTLDLGARESLPHVVKALSEVVEHEGPVSQGIALMRLKEAGQVARAGRRIKAVFDAAVDTLRKRGAIQVDRDGFLRSATTRSMTMVRTPKDDDPATNRDVSDVPQEELRLAVLGLLKDAITAEPEELAVRTARLFGWRRRGPEIGRALEKAIKALIKEKLVTREGPLLRPVSGDR